ncbi:MAG: class I SAM-dependent methyltransferase [Terriglobia bacterium]
MVERNFEHLVQSVYRAGRKHPGYRLYEITYDSPSSQRVVAIEPHLPYLEKARARVPWAEFHHTDGLNYFPHSREMFDCILLIDVVEHLEPRQACRLVREASLHAKKIVLSLIPYGIHEQTKDAWNLGGEFWQTHRSTWDSTNLSQLGFSFFHVWKNWYEWTKLKRIRRGIRQSPFGFLTSRSRNFKSRSSRQF